MTQNWEAAVAALGRSPADVERGTRRLRRISRALLIFSVLLYLAFLVFAGTQLLAAWRSGDPQDWRDFWDTARDILRVSPFFLLPFMATWKNVIRVSERIIALRQAASARDDTLAPLAAIQPEPGDIGVAAGNSPIGPLQRPHGLRGTKALATAIVCFTFAAITGIGAFVALLADLGQPSQVLFIVLLATAVPTMLLLLFGGIAVWRRRCWMRPISVSADEWGLRWREPLGRGRERTIAWHEAEAFVTVHWRATTTFARTDVYALLGPSGAFVWQMRENPTSDEQLAHRALAGLIVARIGQPLRDVTAGIESATHELNGKQKVRRPDIRFPLGTPGTPDAVPGLATESIAPAGRDARSPRDARRVRLGCAGLAILIVPALLLYGAGFGLQREQPHYFGDYLSAITTQRPLYQDSLAVPDMEWPDATAAQGPYYDGELHTGESYLHVGGAYHLKGTDSSRLMYWLPGEVYGDAAVEVTTRELDVADSDGVGLILHVDVSGTSRLVFVVDASGAWWLWSYHCCHANSDDDWSTIAGGWNAAVHAGAGAANTLVAAMHGSDIICFVNGHYLGAYSADGAATIGRVGIYMNTSVTEGIFSNFTVYSLPKGLPLLM